MIELFCKQKAAQLAETCEKVNSPHHLESLKAGSLDPSGTALGLLLFGDSHQYYSTISTVVSMLLCKIMQIAHDWIYREMLQNRVSEGFWDKLECINIPTCSRECILLYK